MKIVPIAIPKKIANSFGLIIPKLEPRKDPSPAGRATMQAIIGMEVLLLI